MTGDQKGSSPSPSPSPSPIASRVTLIGDAAHPMSPFKGQGANQCLLDAIELSRALGRTDLAPLRVRSQRDITDTAAHSTGGGGGGGGCGDGWEPIPLHLQSKIPLAEALEEFERGMAERSKGKVLASREAAAYLHSPVALVTANITRASAAKAAAASKN